MDLKNKVTNFESFGMLDPSDNVKFTDSMIRAKQYFRNHGFKDNVYPELVTYRAV